MKKIHQFVVVAFFALGVGDGLSSCSEADSDFVAFVEDDQLNSPNDTVYSLMGIVNKLQAVADRTILLGELRGDLTALTDHAMLDLQDVANFTVEQGNAYNNARDYYGVIQNCNYFLAHADTALTKTALRRLVTTGKLPSVRIGQKYLVSLEALEDYLHGAVPLPVAVQGIREVKL